MPDVPAGEAEVTVGTDRSHRLVLTWQSRLEQAPVQHSSVLLNEVKRLDVQYWQPDTSVWLDSWPFHSLPTMVRLRVFFRSGDPRHMPDLIAAPMRGRPYG
jgi:general secretion pathway protein J